MDQKIQKLTISIKENIRKFTAGEFSYHDAQHKYAELLNIYETIKSNRSKIENLKQLDGLCYSHNTENYCLFTGIYKISNKNVTLISYYGEDYLNDKIIPIIRRLKQDNKPGETIKITPTEDRRLKNNLYLYFLQNLRGDLFVISSLSSSLYFKKESFKYFGNFIYSLFPYSEKILYNCTDVYKSIDDYIKDNIKDDDILAAHIYYFNDLDKIFNHMGLKYLLSVTSNIEEKIKNNWPTGSPFFNLSIKEYIVLEKLNKNEKIIPKAALNFYYKKIPLPYSYKSVILNNPNDFLLLSSTLFEISNLDKNLI